MHVIPTYRNLDRVQAHLIQAGMLSFLVMGILSGFYFHDILSSSLGLLWLLFVGSACTVIRLAQLVKERRH